MADLTVDVQTKVHAKVVEIARSLGNDARKLRVDESIPASGFLDSAGLLELMMWFETEFDLSISPEELTLENFGTIESMAVYLSRARSGNG